MSRKNRESVMLIFVFMLAFASAKGQVTYGDTIFFDNFGQHITRTTTPYMPAGSYKFADPASGLSDAIVINDNYYAVIDPRHIADASPSFYFWSSSSPLSLTPSGAKAYTTDHTGNANGAVMVVNAGTTLNYLYKRSVTLKTGFQYRFAFWIYLVTKSSQFAMEITNTSTNVTNTVLGPLLSTEGTWILYTLDLPVPLSATDVIQNVTVDLQNKYALVEGNDYYIDDILLSTLHTDAMVLTVTNDSPACEGSNVVLSSNITGGASPYTYAWTGPNGFTSTAQSPVISNCTSASNGTYNLTITDALGYTSKDSTTVVINPNPKSDFFLSTYSIDSKYNTVFGQVLNPDSLVTYVWDLGDGTTLFGPVFPTHVYSVTGLDSEFLVKLTATDSTGCSGSLTKAIEAGPFIPNVFSPNNDGRNDLFMAGFEQQIFDRSGIEIYTGSSGWNGTNKGQKIDPDTYFYILYYYDKNNQKHSRKGYITLIQ